MDYYGIDFNKMAEILVYIKIKDWKNRLLTSVKNKKMTRDSHNVPAKPGAW